MGASASPREWRYTRGARNLGAGKALQAVGRPADARKYFERAAKDVRRHDSMVPNIGNGRGDNNFGGFSQGASATALIELAKNEFAQKHYKAAANYLADAGEAKPSRDELREINQLMLQIQRRLSEQAQQPPPGRAFGASPVPAMIEGAKELIRHRDFRDAGRLLNRAAQLQPTAEQKREIEMLLMQIAREQK